MAIQAAHFHSPRNIDRVFSPCQKTILITLVALAAIAIAAASAALGGGFQLAQAYSYTLLAGGAALALSSLSYIAHKLITTPKIRQSAATVLETIAKGFHARNEVRKKLQERKEHKAATIIQSHFREYVTRKKFHNLALVAKKDIAQSDIARDYAYKRAFAIQRASEDLLSRLDATAKKQEAKAVAKALETYRLMSLTIPMLMGDKKKAEENMKGFTSLPIEAFNEPLLSFYGIIYQSALFKGIDRKTAKGFLPETLKQLGILCINPKKQSHYLVRNDFLATITLVLLPKNDSLLIPIQRIVSSISPKEKGEWNDNTGHCLVGLFFKKFEQKVRELVKNTVIKKRLDEFISDLRLKLETARKSTFIKLDKNTLPVEENRAHELRFLAHALAYEKPDVGSSCFLNGETIYCYYKNGVNIFIYFEPGANKLHFFNGGTEDAAGWVRDFSFFSKQRAPGSWTSAYNEQSYAINHAILSVLKRVPGDQRLDIEVHGHSLGGHDAQMWGLTLAKEIEGGFLRDRVASLLINTQNSLRVDEEYAKEFAELLPVLLEEGVSVNIHIGHVPGDVVEHAGDYHLGAFCGECEGEDSSFTLTIVEHSSSTITGIGAILSAAPHTIQTTETTLRFITDPNERGAITSKGRFGANGTVFQYMAQVGQQVATALPYLVLGLVNTIAPTEPRGGVGLIDLEEEDEEYCLVPRHPSPPTPPNR